MDRLFLDVKDTLGRAGAMGPRPSKRVSEGGIRRQPLRATNFPAVTPHSFTSLKPFTDPTPYLQVGSVLMDREQGVR